jgi:FKBP-type peptidyl-prolyl cis-trans isomerase FkpA
MKPVLDLAPLLLACLCLAACPAPGGDDDDDSATGDDDDSAPAWVETGSGLRYLDVLVGEGAVAEPGDVVFAHYTGWLHEDGARGDEFDSSRGGNPFSFTLGAGQVIAGWDEGLQGMAVGGQRTLILPPELGYGAQGAGGGLIPPNATLEFEVELMDLQ